jgi:hypothetical protein
MLNQIVQFFLNHPGLAVSGAAGAVQLVNFLGTGVISNLPAPTKDSTPKYIFWFKFLNWIMGNWGRAHSTALESSPNWEAAVTAHVQRMADSGLIIARPPDKTP